MDTDNTCNIHMDFNRTGFDDLDSTISLETAQPMAAEMRVVR